MIDTKTLIYRALLAEMLFTRFSAAEADILFNALCSDEERDEIISAMLRYKEGQ